MTECQIIIDQHASELNYSPLKLVAMIYCYYCDVHGAEDSQDYNKK